MSVGLRHDESGFNFVTKECPITVGMFEGFSWIRCEGKGSFMNSPALKEWGEMRIAAGEDCLVVDLESCLGMDSTFMGALAGLAVRLRDAGGRLDVAAAGVKNRASLEDLGLDFLMGIEPKDGVWQGNEGRVREFLEVWKAGMKKGTDRHTRHILEAHRVLSDASEENAEKFSGVVDTLEKELASKNGSEVGR